MRRTSTILALLLAAHLVLADSGLLAPHARALSNAEAFDTTYSVSVVGGAQNSYHVVLAKPNKLMIETSTTKTFADGANVTVYTKATNSYYTRPQTVAPQTLLQEDALRIWLPFFDTAAYDKVLSTKNEGTRKRQGETLRSISAQVDSQVKLVLHLASDNFPRQAELTNGSVVTIFSVESVATTAPQGVFEFKAPEGSTRVSEFELRKAFLRTLIVVPTNEQIDGLDTFTKYKPVAPANAALIGDLTELFLEEFSKYPTEFVKSTGLRRVAIVQDLHIAGQHRAATPLGKSELLMYDVTFLSNRLYMRYVLHHEFYHMIEEQAFGDVYFKDPKWAAFNEPGFKYGSGTSSAYGRGGDLVSPTFPRKGFITGYSLYGLEEDKADTWASCFIPEYWRLVEPVLATDSIIKAKVDYLKAFAKSKCPAMDDAYWKALIPPG